ncbi:MAG TPA: lactate racemase domain-containing protein [bacterium]|nr:lactate racemase domain-containing protein [bacterium]HPN43718.1 lactate racemase domain-containing protein [bacterium]
MVTGYGSTTTLLAEQQIAELCKQGLNNYSLSNKKILVVIPDHSRTAPIDVMFRTVYNQLADKVKLLDFIIALGTHPPMSDEAINHRVGITQQERTSKYPRARFFNHHWNDPQQLVTIGALSEQQVKEISGGRMSAKVNVTINKMILDYDVIMIIGPTFPHEVVGFSGGSKYLFPGLAGKEIIDMFHWLGALITNPAIIGTKYTPVRRVVDLAAGLIPAQQICLSLVVKGEGLAGLYIGEPREAWEQAADLSEKLHIQYMDHPFHTVLSCAPAMYDDLWTGGKCMYKLEPVVANGGELIIYAPHIKEVSVTHGAMIETIGYHVRDYYVKQMDKFKNVPGGVMAHSTHVRGVGEFINGVEKPRIRVTLATQIPEALCHKINMGYRDPATINKQDFMNRESEGILYVAKAGEMLYRLKNDPFRKEIKA